MNVCVCVVPVGSAVQEQAAGVIVQKKKKEKKNHFYSHYKIYL